MHLVAAVLLPSAESKPKRKSRKPNADLGGGAAPPWEFLASGGTSAVGI
jgi:hypothetical protein